MTSLPWHVLADLPLAVVGLCLVHLRPLPLAMVVGACSGAGIHLVRYLDLNAVPPLARAGMTIPFWSELPAWVAMGTLWPLFFMLVFRILAWAFHRLPGPPG